VLTDPSSPDPHTMRNGLTWTLEMETWLRLLPRALAGWLSRVLWGCYPMSLLEVATSVITIIMMMINNILISTL
jgi:hypothetical protein